jgi:acyl-CoA reductase-like NAD-dependent aldehyde dehydrogenase
LRVHFRPLGVVGVITPWNGPFILSLNPTVQALLAGNAVVLKPSEVTPFSPRILVELLREAGVPEGVVTCLDGDGETGAALVNGGVDKISFTGSVRTGKRIAEACAKQLIPCTLELGGKDAMIVCEDADLERAASGAVFNSMFNTGQVCIGVERIYVVEKVADKFCSLVKEKVKALRHGQGENSDVGSVFWDKQIAIIQRHIDDAKSKGATIEVGGDVDTAQGDLFFKPTLVTNVTHDMALMKEETFGPVAAIMRVKDEEEAIRLANDSDYGLSASVWTKDKEKGVRIAKRIQAGSVIINDASMMYGVLEASFGGIKDSGLGQVNGPNALRSYTHELPILIDRWGLPKEEVWYPYTEKTAKTLQKTLTYMFSTPLRRLFS